jgi:hypothetical protein
MTSAYGHPVPTGRTALARRFGDEIEPLDLTEQDDPGDGGRRARFIATLHALIAWLVAHPEVPCPWTVGMNIRVPDVAALEQLAAQFDVRPYPRTGTPEQFTLFQDVGDGEFYVPISITVDDPEKGRPL